MLAELLKSVGESYCERHLTDFGIEKADFVADFYNNGGLEFHNNGLNYALQYASLEDGRVQIGTWAWFDGEDFDQDATFEVYDEDELSEGELRAISKKIKAIYGAK